MVAPPKEIISLAEDTEGLPFSTASRMIQTLDPADRMWKQEYPLHINGHAADLVVVSTWMEDIIDHVNGYPEVTILIKFR